MLAHLSSGAISAGKSNSDIEFSKSITENRQACDISKEMAKQAYAHKQCNEHKGFSVLHLISTVFTHLIKKNMLLKEKDEKTENMNVCMNSSSGTLSSSLSPKTCS